MPPLVTGPFQEVRVGRFAGVVAHSFWETLFIGLGSGLVVSDLYSGTEVTLVRPKRPKAQSRNARQD